MGSCDLYYGKDQLDFGLRRLSDFWGCHRRGETVRIKIWQEPDWKKEMNGNHNNVNPTRMEPGSNRLLEGENSSAIRTGRDGGENFVAQLSLTLWPSVHSFHSLGKKKHSWLLHLRCPLFHSHGCGLLPSTTISLIFIAINIIVVFLSVVLLFFLLPSRQYYLRNAKRENKIEIELLTEWEIRAGSRRRIRMRRRMPMEKDGDGDRSSNGGVSFREV